MDRASSYYWPLRNRRNRSGSARKFSTGSRSTAGRLSSSLRVGPSSGIRRLATSTGPKRQLCRASSLEFSVASPYISDAVAIRAEELSGRHAKIRNAAAQIYSRLADRSLDEVIGDDVRQFRRNRISAGAALAIVAALSALYVLQRDKTIRQETIATARRQLDMARGLALDSMFRNGGPDAVNISEDDAGRA